MRTFGAHCWILSRKGCHISTQAAVIRIRWRVFNWLTKNSSSVSFFRSGPNHRGSAVSRLLTTVMNFCFFPDRSHPRPSVPARASSWPLPIAPGTADRWLGPCSPVTETAAPPVAQLPTRRPTQGRRGKKVHGGNDLAVVLQKGQPVPLRIPRVLVGRNDGRRRGCRFLLINPLRVNSRAPGFSRYARGLFIW
jgi:hypothetical protein